MAFERRGPRLNGAATAVDHARYGKDITLHSASANREATHLPAPSRSGTSET